MRLELRARFRSILFSVVVLVLALAGARVDRVTAQEPPMRWDGLIELISGKYEYPTPTTTPQRPADGPSWMSRHAISADGRYVLFNATAPVLGYYDTALYLRDRRANELRVLLGGPALNAALSADGNHVAFEICDPNGRPELRPDYPAVVCDVWTLDVRSWAWRLMSASPDGTVGDADSREPVLSSDGRFVAFRTQATNLPAPGTPPGQIILRDRDADGNGIFDEPGTAVLEVVSVSGTGEAGNGPSETAEISDDGRYVAFRSAASNLVAGDTNGIWDVFRRDRQTSETRRLNVRPEGQESSSPIDSPQISMTPDGRYVAFTSADGLLAPGSIDDYNNVADVLIFDAQAQYLARIDIGWGPPIASGYVPGNGPTEWPTLSADGRYVSLQSAATNVEVPPPPGSTHAYVVDRLMQTATRVSIKPNGTEADADCVRPAISADGSLVTFLSQAINLASDVSLPWDRIYAAVHLAIAPSEAFVPGSGGSATFTITTQQHTQWWVDWTDWPSWLTFDSPPMGVGSGDVTFRAGEANPNAVARSATIRVFERSATFTQEAGLSLTSISPTSGPATGGTQVTFTGTGFEPSTQVVFDGYPATATQFVNSTTLVATAPAHEPATVWVAVFNSNQSAWLDFAFRYADTTPPDVIMPLVSGTMSGDWYTSDVTVEWFVSDSQSAVTATEGCARIVIDADTSGTTITCTATSEGGTASASTTIRRDATGPTASIALPMATTYPLGATIRPEFLCDDALSGVRMCGIAQGSDPIDTSTPGPHTFSIVAEDLAGNPSLKSVEYIVEADAACTLPAESLQAWWRFEQDGFDALEKFSAFTEPYSEQTYGPGVNGFAWTAPAAGAYLRSSDSYHLLASPFGLTVAAWVKPTGEVGESGTILAKPSQYRVARYPDGTLRWAFNQTTGFTWVNTGATIPRHLWTHVAVSYEAGLVKTYVNGNLVHTEQLTGTLTASEPWYEGLTIGGRPNVAAFFQGSLDEVQVYDHPLSSVEVQATVAAAGRGVCVPRASTLSLTFTDPVGYGPTFRVTALLRDAEGNPIVDRPVVIHSYISADNRYAGTASWWTDANGEVRLDVPIAANAPFGDYARGFEAFFEGDARFKPVYVNQAMTLVQGTPIISWPTPSTITYGTPLGVAQLNATANTAGTFEYSPAAGTILPAGTHTLGVTFYPSDAVHYVQTTATTTITVAKAQPIVSIVGGTWEYDAQPKTAVAEITGALGESLPVTLTYDGLSGPPIDAGTYWARAYYPGSANYLFALGSAQIRIEPREPFVTLTAGPFTYDGQPHPAAVRIQGITGEDLGPYDVTYNGGHVVPISAGTYDVRVQYNGSRNYKAVTHGTALIIQKATPVVTVVGGTFTYNGEPQSASASVQGVDGVPLGPVMFTYNGSSSAPVNAGTYDVVGSYAGDTNYNPVSNTATLTITRATPTVVVNGGTFTYDGQPHTASGTVTGGGGASLGPLTFTYNGSSDAPVNAGTYTVVATFEGDANHSAASGTGTLRIDKATPAVNVTGGTFSYNAQPRPATGSVTGIGGVSLGTPSFTYNGLPDAPVNAGSYSVVASFAGNGNYSAATNTATLTINKAVPTLVVTGGTFTYDGLPHPATGSVTGVGGVNLGTPTFTYDGSPDPPVNVGSYRVIGSYPGDVNYSSASRAATIAIAKATPVLGWSQPAGIVYGSALGAGQLNATSNVAGTFTYTPAAGTVLNAGSAQVLSATFTPADAANYDGGTVSTSIDVAKAPPTMNINGGTFTYDAASHAASGLVTGVAGEQLGPIHFTYNGSAAEPVNAGTYDVVGTYEGNANYAGVSATTTLTITKATAVLSWDQPAAIVYGTALGAAQLNATSNVAGAFVYTPGAGTVLNAGAGQALGATFTPADAQNYTGGSVGTTIDVARAALTVRANDAAKPFGAPLPVFTASVTGFVNGDAVGSLGGSLAFATTATQLSPVGAYPIVPSGVTSSNYAIAFVSGTLVIVRGAVTVAVTTSPEPSGLDQSMAFTATVAAVAPAAGVPTGTVRFFDGSTLLGTATLSGDMASLTTAGLDAGTRAIEARYDGDASFESGTGSTSHVINDAAGTPTISITSSRNPSNVGQSVTLTANVSMLSGAVTGTMQFYDGATLLGSSAISAERATFTTSSLPAGSHAITARYVGSASAPPAQSGVFVQAVGAPGWKNRTTTMTVSAAPNPSGLGDSVVVTANVTGSGPSTPTGRILFMVDGQVVGDPAGEPISLVSGTTAGATFSLSGLNHGRHKVTATYLGDQTFKGSTASVSQTVN